MVDVGEGLTLVAAVVGRRGAPVRAFDTQLGAPETPRDESVGRAGRAAILEAGFVSPMAAPIDRNLTAALAPGRGGDVDDAGGPQAVLGGHGAGDQVQLADQPRAEGLAEDGNAFRQD